MIHSTTPVSAHLPTLVEPGHSARIVDGLGTEVRVLDGVVWITQAGDQRDIVLYAGGTFTLDRNGLTLVVAIDNPAKVVIKSNVDRQALPEAA